MNKGAESRKEYTELNNLIRLAQGNRSLRTYAEMSGVSASNLSRILNGRMAKTPSREMLEKLTSEEAQPQNGITLESLLLAAGYQDKPVADIQLSSDDLINFDSTDYIIEKISSDNAVKSSYERILLYFLLLNKYKGAEPVTIREKYHLFENIAPGIIFQHLTKVNVPFQIDTYLNGSFKDIFSDMVLSIQEDEKNIKWCFEFKTALSDMHTFNLAKDRILYPLIGRLSMLPPDSQKKYSLVTDIPQFSEEIKRTAENNSLKANFSVILIDIEKMEFKEEVIVSTY